jgi:surface protein
MTIASSAKAWEVNGHEFVDLGLPSGTLWATCNVGANSPEEYGDHFAWGETEPKDCYNWDTYKWYDGTGSTISKYNNIDGQHELLPEDDAASVNWGGTSWCMPSLAQMQELRNEDYTTSTWTTLNGVNGRLIKSKINGQSIFLPASGVMVGDEFDYYARVGIRGDYWARTSQYLKETEAPTIYFYENIFDSAIRKRCDGCSVRPVIATSDTPVQAYAELLDGFMYFHYDDQWRSREGEVFDLNTGNEEPAWHGKVSQVQYVIFDESFADARPTSTYFWFNNMTNLKHINGINYLNTSMVTTMRGMFSLCESLDEINLSNFNTDKVTDMKGMFYECETLTSLDLSRINTENVTDMSDMFGNCRSLKNLYVNSLDTKNVTDMNCMFRNCSSLTNLNITHFITDKVTGMRSMFEGCSSLNSTLDLSNFRTSEVTNMTSMFQNCSNLKAIKLSSLFNTSKVESMNHMFCGCSSLTNEFNSSIKSFITTNVMFMRQMFRDCSSLTYLDLSSFNTSNVADMVEMFWGCGKLETIYAGSGWETSSVAESVNMFLDCVKLVGMEGTTYDPSKVDMTYARIDGGISDKGYLSIKMFVYDGVYYYDIGYGLVGVTHKKGEYGTYSGDLVIPESVYNNEEGWWYTVSEIGENAFYRCPYLMNLTIPATIDIINNKAFVDAFLDASRSSITCYSTRPPVVSPTAFDSNIQEMTLYVMPGCKSAYEAAKYWQDFGTIVELPYSFVKNGIYYKITGEGTVSVSYKDANYNCYRGDVVIPNTVTYDDVTYTVTKIDNLAFFNCSDLTSVTIPESVTVIGNRTFYGCTSLTSITIPNSVTSIGLHAFENCEAMTKITLGSGLLSIGDYAFYGCTELMRGNITCLATEPPTIAANTFIDQYQGASLYVPYGCHDVYANARYWDGFYDIFELPASTSEEEFAGTIYQEVNVGGQIQILSETDKTVRLTFSQATPGLVDITFPAIKVVGSNNKIQSFTIKDVCIFTDNDATVLMLPNYKSMILRVGKSEMLPVFVKLDGAIVTPNMLVLKLSMLSISLTQMEYTIWFGSNIPLEQIEALMDKVEEFITGVDDIEISTKDDAIYDLSGRKIEKITHPGIYIKNGKKVMIK